MKSGEEIEKDVQMDVFFCSTGGLPPFGFDPYGVLWQNPLCCINGKNERPED